MSAVNPRVFIYLIQGCGALCHSPADDQYNTEVPPQNVSDAVGWFRSHVPSNQKIIVAPVNHQAAIYDFTNDGEWNGSSFYQNTPIDYNPQQYINLTNKQDALFESSYYLFPQPANNKNWLNDLYSNILTPGPGTNEHYLAKFKTLDYFKPKCSDVQATVCSEICTDLISGAGYPTYQAHLHSDYVNIKNANYLWFLGYTSIIHGVNGIWTYDYDSYLPSEKWKVDYYSQLNYDRYTDTYLSDTYKNFTSKLAKEIRLLVNKNILNTDVNTILYSKTDVADPNCGIAGDPTSYTNYIPSDFLTNPIYAEKRTTPYGLRYTIRTNGNEVFMIVTNPLNVSFKATLNFNNTANPTIKNSTGVEVWFENTDPTNIATVSSTTYKTTRNYNIDLINNTVDYKFQVNYAIQSNKQITLAFGPMDTHVLKFIATTPPSSNGWTNVWSNFGTSMIDGHWVQTFDEFIPGDFDGDGTDELLCIQKLDNNAWATMLKYKNAGSNAYDWEWEWTNNGNGYIGTHQIKAADKFVVGNFDGTSNEELFCINGYDNNANAQMEQYAGGSWTQKYSNAGNGLFGGWGIKAGDKYVAGDFWGDSHKELLCVQNFDANSWAAIKNYSNNDWQWGCNNGGNGLIQSNWGIHAIDEYKVGDLNGDGKMDDLLCIQKGGYYAAIFKNFSTNGSCAWNWTQLWNNWGSGGIGGWGNPVKTDDKILVGNIDGDSKYEMMFIQTCSSSRCVWATTEDLNGSNAPTWNWSNQTPPASNYIHDWPVYDASGSNVNYLFIKPHPTDKKYLMAFRKYGCNDFLVNMYKTSGAGNYKESAGVNNSSTELINIFPNPSTGEFTIDISRINSENYRIEVYNIYGSVVKSISRLENQNDTYVQTDLNELSSGIYFIKIISDSMTETHKVIVNK